MPQPALRRTGSLVLRVRQAGEKPSWLLPPGQSLAFTWSQPAAQPRTAEWCVTLLCAAD